MIDLSNFNPNVAANPDNTIFGLPFQEEDARVILLPFPWEVTVSCGAALQEVPTYLQGQFAGGFF